MLGEFITLGELITLVSAELLLQLYRSETVSGEIDKTFQKEVMFLVLFSILIYKKWTYLPNKG